MSPIRSTKTALLMCRNATEAAARQLARRAPAGADPRPSEAPLSPTAHRAGMTAQQLAGVDGDHFEPFNVCEHELDRFLDPREAPLAAMWLGHASTLLRLGETLVLTDPVFSERIGPRIAGQTLGLNRCAPLHPIARRILDAQIRLDVVLLSHAHFDHLDRATLAAVAKRQTVVVTAKGTSGLIPPGFGRVIELDWKQRAGLAGLRIDAVEPNHWGARVALDRHRGCNAYVIEGGAITRADERGLAREPARVLFAGDTAFTNTFDRVGPLDLALLGVGCYEPWARHHATPAQAWAMAHRAGAARVLPIHHGAFPLAKEPREEPLRWFLAEAEMRGDTDRVAATRLGQPWFAPWFVESMSAAPSVSARA